MSSPCSLPSAGLQLIQVSVWFTWGPPALDSELGGAEIDDLHLPWIIPICRMLAG